MLLWPIVFSLKQESRFSYMFLKESPGKSAIRLLPSALSPGMYEAAFLTNWRKTFAETFSYVSRPPAIPYLFNGPFPYVAQFIIREHRTRNKIACRCYKCLCPRHIAVPHREYPFFYKTFVLVKEKRFNTTLHLSAGPSSYFRYHILQFDKLLFQIG